MAHGAFVSFAMVSPTPGQGVPQQVPEIAAVLKRYALADARRLITSLSPDDLLRIEREQNTAQEDSLVGYWQLDVRHLSPDKAGQLVKDLKALGVVTDAYRELPVSDPQVNAANDPLAVSQGHLAAAPRGIDARFAWTTAGVSGSGVGVVDLEQSWHQHTDVPKPLALPNVPALVNTGGLLSHGTSVLGVLVAIDNRTGGIGIAPGAFASIASHFRADGTDGHVADTIMALVGQMSAGDILLLEVQKGDVLTPPGIVPTEFDNADLKAIKKAVAKGIVVIEAAGNGNQNLDAIPALSRHSGAILVGAGQSTVSRRGHQRWVLRARAGCPPPPVGLPGGFLPGSNFGARVRCHAWGEDVVTTGVGPAPILKSIHTKCFGGTSAAAAIVAGAALLVQSARKAAGKSPLSSDAMGDLLESTGTRQAPPASGATLEPIGTMPNLKKAIPAALALP